MSGRIYGYARVSTADQDLSIQESALKAFGCEVIRSEKASGTTTTGRTQLQILMDFLTSGDTLVVTRIDRLARSIADLQTIAGDLRKRGISLKVIEQPIDTSTSAGKLFFDMLGAFAEFETAIRKDRQLEGIAKAKAEGKYKGMPPKIERTEVIRLTGEGKGPAEIAKGMGISRMSVYRILKENAAAQGV